MNKHSHVKYFRLFDTHGLECTTIAPYYAECSDAINWKLLNEKIAGMCKEHILNDAEKPQWAYAKIVTDYEDLSSIRPLNNYIYFGEEQ